MRRQVWPDAPINMAEFHAYGVDPMVVGGVQLWHDEGRRVVLVEDAAQALLAGHPARLDVAFGKAWLEGPIYIGPEVEWPPDRLDTALWEPTPTNKNALVAANIAMTWDGTWVLPYIVSSGPEIVLWSQGREVPSGRRLMTIPAVITQDSNLSGGGAVMYRIVVNAFAALGDRVVVEAETVSTRKGRRLLQRGKDPGRHVYRMLRLTRDAEHVVENARRVVGQGPLRVGPTPALHEVGPHMQRYWVKERPPYETDARETPHGTRYAVWRRRRGFSRGAGPRKTTTTTLIRAPKGLT